MSSMMSKGIVEKSSICSLRVPSRAGIGEVIDERVGFAIQNAIALLNGGLTNRLGEMTLTRSGRPEEQGVFMFGNEVSPDFSKIFDNNLTSYL